MAPGKTAFQLGGELVDQPDAGLDQLLAGPGQGAQHLGGVAVLGQRGEPVPVGAQHVGEQVGIAGVGLGAGAGVAGAQSLDLAWGDHHDPQAGVEQRLDQRAVAAFDRHPCTLSLVSRLTRPVKVLPVLGISNRARIVAVVVDDADHVGLAGPVDAGEQLSVQSGVHSSSRPSCEDGEHRRCREAGPDAHCVAVQPAYP